MFCRVSNEHLFICSFFFPRWSHWRSKEDLQGKSVLSWINYSRTSGNGKSNSCPAPLNALPEKAFRVLGRTVSVVQRATDVQVDIWAKKVNFSTRHCWKLLCNSLNDAVLAIPLYFLIYGQSSMLSLLYTLSLWTDLKFMYQSNRSFNIPPPSGHTPGIPRAFDVFSCPGGGNLINLIFPGAGIWSLVSISRYESRWFHEGW